MKKAVLFLCFITLAIAASAGPATPYPVKMAQPDGSTITLRIHGDEYYNWYTSEDGKTVYERGEDLWWRPASGRKPRRRAEPRINQGWWGENGNGMGNKHIPVLLVEFSDKPLHEGAYDYFRRALNDPGFSDNGQYGSVRDYYIDASYGLFTPEFDVMGPVRISRKSTDKISGDDSGNNALARTVIFEAMAMLDPTVDFSIYDHDNDGYIDTIALIFPGMGQEEGGGPDAIWSHSSHLTYSGQKSFDGKIAGTYFCSPEMSSDLSSFHRIGTFCHEFGHTLGLPDLYDTNYEENGTAPHPSYWNLMAAGNHLPVPPRLSTFERYLLGYISSLETIDGEGAHTIPGLDQRKAYILPASNGGEYFLFEVRNTYGWDSCVPSGLLVYHIDTSLNQIHDTNASAIWNSNQINAYGDHPCYYILGSVGNDSWSSWCIKSEPDYTLTEWSGEPDYRLLNISYDAAFGQAAFDVKFVAQHISGYVYDKDGNPINGAVLNLSSAATEEILATTTTEFGGYYSFYPDESMPEDLVITAFGRDCISQKANVHGHYVIKDFTLESVYTDSFWIDSRATLADFGISYIQSPSGQLHAGEPFPLKLVKSVTGEIESLHWYVDGNEITEDSVTFSSGQHTVKAVIAYKNYYGDGLESDTIELVINVL